MIQQISWQGYWTTLAIIVAVYYVLVIFLYYRNDLILLLRRGHAGQGAQYPGRAGGVLPEQKHTKEQWLADDDVHAFVNPQPGSEEQIVYCCMDECNAFFEAAKSSKPVKKDLLFSLQQILSKYPTLKNSTYKESISNVIAAQCKQNCVIHLEASDKVLLWAGT